MTELSGRRGRAAKLVNRLSERDALDRLIEEVQDGHSRALVMRGDPGVGKTVLLEYLAGRASGSGCRVARALSMSAAWRGDFAAAASLIAESDAVCEVTGSRAAPYAAMLLASLRGDQAAGWDYDGTKLAAEGLVVVTINHRLGAFGFLAHPALATEPGGPSGNYGLMDQQATLRWVQGNIGRFGGDPHNVTIAGQSSGGTSVLAHMISRGSRGLFHRAIVQSGSFALTQQSLAAAQADGEAFAAKAGCLDQTADCLRRLPVADLVSNFPGAAIPGVVDGAVLEESVGTALAAGRFARVPILNGINHDEQRGFVTAAEAVNAGAYVPVPEPVTTESYQHVIASVLSVPAARAAAIAAEYPLSAYPSPPVAFSALVSDANFACPALQIDRWTSRWVPTFAYEFNDDNAPLRYPPQLTGPPVATQVRVPVPVRPAGRAAPGTAQPGPAGPRGQHANGLGELRGQRQPGLRGRALARIRRGQHPDAVARTAATTDRDRLRLQAPLRVLGGLVATPHERYWHHHSHQPGG